MTMFCRAFTWFDFRHADWRHALLLSIEYLHIVGLDALGDQSHDCFNTTCQKCKKALLSGDSPRRLMYNPVASVSSNAQHFTPLTLIITTGWQTFSPTYGAVIAAPSFVGWVGWSQIEVWCLCLQWAQCTRLRQWAARWGPLQLKQSLFSWRNVFLFGSAWDNCTITRLVWGTIAENTPLWCIRVVLLYVKTSVKGFHAGESRSTREGRS